MCQMCVSYVYDVCVMYVRKYIVCIGSFVKIQLTYHKSDGEEVKVYKVCVVEGVGTHKRAYKLPDSRLTTDKMLTLAIGTMR